jgi:hypothetical protein
VKINVGLCRKLPGDEPYSSRGASIEIEVDLPQDLANDPLKLQAQIKKLFTQAHNAVIDELYNRTPVRGNAQQSTPRPQVVNNNGRQPVKQQPPPPPPRQRQSAQRF